MFEHHLIEPSVDGDPDRPEPVVISVPDLGAETLRALPAYLLDILPIRFNIDGIETHLGARPLVFATGGGKPWFSERAIWALLVEMPNAADHVVAYVSAALSDSHNADGLCFCSFLDVVGQEPIYAYLDRYVRGYPLKEAGDLRDHLRVVDAFLAFLRRCDMDHEVFQDDYIQVVLRFLYWKDDERLIDLLCFRLTVGQYSEPMPEYARYLAEKGGLKKTVDCVIAKMANEGWQLRVTLLELCALAYGSNAECRTAVLDYCRQRVDLGDQADLKNFQKDLDYLAAQRDAWLERFSSHLNTGFHVRHKGTGHWDWIAGPNE